MPNTGLLFQELKALFTSLGSTERQDLEALWREHGGKVAGSVTPNDPPHVVVTRRVGSSKYISLMRRHPNTHVVSPEWIIKSVEQKKKVPYSQYRVGSLYGLKICLSGFDVDKKDQLARLISRNGGTHSPSLTKFCTHLVSTDKTTQKYKFASKHNIVCCSLDWLLESTTGRVPWCRDAAKYHVKDKEMSLVLSKDAITAPKANSPIEIVANTTAVCEEVARETQQNFFDHVTVDHQDSLGVDDAFTFGEKYLGDCGIWPVGLSTAELNELVKLCCSSGATRYSFLHPSLITHIVRGSEPCTRAEMNEITQSLQWAANAPKLVNMDWIRSCIRCQQELCADDYKYVPREEGPVRVLNRLESSRSLPAIHQSNEASNMSGSTSNDGIFSGYYFTLCAIRGSSEESIAEVIVRQNGGKINNTSIPSSGEGKLLAICPPSLTRIDASRLRSQNNSNFASVAEDGRFTVYWLKCCSKAKKMLAHMDGAPCFKPLPFELPMEGTRGLSISMSGYDEDIKSAIKHTIETIGGQVSIENMSAKDTHLIVPHAHGQKYKHSARLGVIPVTSQWLVESVRAGRILPESRFKPLPKQGRDADILAKSSKLDTIETTQHEWAKDSAVHPQKRVKASTRTKMIPIVNKNSTDQATSDDLDKAGKQVTSLLSRLQQTKTAANVSGELVNEATLGGAAATNERSSKNALVRSYPRSSSRRTGLHKSSQAEPNKSDEHNDEPFEMVSQRVAYEER
jgi:hypothetical protein